MLSELVFLMLFPYSRAPVKEGPSERFRALWSRREDDGFTAPLVHTVLDKDVAKEAKRIGVTYINRGGWDLLLDPTFVCTSADFRIVFAEVARRTGRTKLKLKQLPEEAWVDFSEEVARQAGGLPEENVHANPEIEMETHLVIRFKRRGKGSPITRGFRFDWFKSGAGPAVIFNPPVREEQRPRQVWHDFNILNYDLDQVNDMFDHAYGVWRDQHWSAREKEFETKLRAAVRANKSFQGLSEDFPLSAASLPPMLQNAVCRTVDPRRPAKALAKEVEIQAIEWQVEALLPRESPWSFKNRRPRILLKRYALGELLRAP
ncbi:MAG: hypothetical protein JST35_04435 [Armatimonadetes bacterium]|nr:hypothetical protein [Armatimonadota bacterium]